MLETTHRAAKVATTPPTGPVFLDCRQFAEAGLAVQTADTVGALDVIAPRASTALKPLVALAYHHRYTTAPESLKALPNGEAWLASVERFDENVRHLAVHRAHNLDISNGHDALVDVSAAKQTTFTGTREECANVSASPSQRRDRHHLWDQRTRCGARAGAYAQVTGLR